MDFKKFAPVPPMGWNSWNCFGASVDEENLLANAEYMAKHLKQYGWEYVVCDIQWYQPTAHGQQYAKFTELEMDEFSRLIPAVNRFPSAANGKGFKPIADKIHAMGLKFGIHIMRGIPRQAAHYNTATVTPGVTARDLAHHYSVCPWNTDMYGIDHTKKGAQEYYDSLLELYASWDVDYIKCDDIANTEFKPSEPYSAEKEIEMLRKAIDKCGREIVLSLSPGPAPVANAEHLCQNANLWRMTGDFWDEWEKLYAMFERCETWQPYVSPGNWPDCDMLPLGMLCIHMPDGPRMTRFTHDENVTMMTLWSIFRSPLMLGCNLPDNDEETLSLITNADVLEANQQITKSQLANKDGNIICWTGESEKYRYAAVFNTGDNAAEVELDFEKLGFRADTAATELWTKQPVTAGKVSINSHGALFCRQ